MICHLFAELVTFPEDFSHGLDNVIRVAVGLCEYQRLGYLVATRKDLRQAIAEGLDDGTNLVRVDDILVKLLGGIGLVFVLALPAFLARQALSLFYHLIGRWMIQTPHLSLPNILAGEKIVPEFMPYYTSTRPIAEAALDLLADDAKREAMCGALDKLVEPLREGSASIRTAELLLELIRRHQH